MSLTKVTYSMIAGEAISVIDYGADVTGTNDSSTAIQNAINAAVAGAGIVYLPAGTYKLVTGLTIDDAIIMYGAGSCNDNGADAKTTLNYTGSGVAIDIVGSGANGKENIHLRDFSLVGTVSALGGIFVGSDVNVTKSSIKNVHVKSFTNTSQGYGIKISNCLQTLFENTYCQSNFNGWYFDGQPTTATFINCYGRSSVNYNWYIEECITGTFINCVTEAGGKEGLKINGTCSNLHFLGWHSESNQQTSGTAPINITGGCYNIVFDTPYVGDSVGGLSFDADNVNGLIFNNPVFTTFASGFGQVTANTIYSRVYTSVECYTNYVLGNSTLGMLVNDGQGFATKTLTSGSASALNFINGTFVVRDVTNNKSGIVTLNGSANTVTIVSDPDSFLANSATAGKVVVYYSSGAYRILNNLVGTATIQMSSDFCNV